MSAEDPTEHEREAELALFREYRDVVGQFKYAVETERRFYLANDVEVVPGKTSGPEHFELHLRDAWCWELYRQNRFVKSVRVLTAKDINIEELNHQELRLPDELSLDD